MVKVNSRVVFAAMSKSNFYLREYVIKYILEKGYTPMCAFMMYSYFLLGTVDRSQLINANNRLIERSDELWVFGEVTRGVQLEIDLANKRKMKIKYFSVTPESLEFKEVVKSGSDKDLQIAV